MILKIVVKYPQVRNILNDDTYTYCYLCISNKIQSSKQQRNCKQNIVSKLLFMFQAFESLNMYINGSKSNKCFQMNLQISNYALKKKILSLQAEIFFS